MILIYNILSNIGNCSKIYTSRNKCSIIKDYSTPDIANEDKFVASIPC